MDDRFILFSNLIANINRDIFLIKDEETVKYNLKSTHVACIYNIYHHKSLTQVELIELCEENKAAISRTLGYLIENDFVKIDDPECKYKKHYSLTKKGENISTEIDKRVKLLLEEASGSISNSDREIMYKCLNIIESNLSKIVKNK